MSKPRLVFGLVISLAIVVLGIIAYFAVGPIRFAHELGKDIAQHERQLLYATDHTLLARELRQFAIQHGWQEEITDLNHPVFRREAIPSTPSIRSARPAAIAIFDDRVELECGGTLLHFGIAVFKPGLEGSGQKRLGDGIWFYSEDRRVPPP